LRKLPDSSRNRQRRLQERRRRAFGAIIAGKGPEESSSKPSELSEQDLEDPVRFVQKALHFNPTEYQAKLLRETSKRIVVVYPRQSGKSTTIAARAIWFACKNPKTVTLIVAPGLRQSMIMMDHIHSFLMGMHNVLRREHVGKMQRTVIWFKNGSQIVALPCSTNLLRGYSANQCICDESAFFRDDETMFYSVLFPMLQTTQGTLIASSTPWTKDSVFYRFTQDAAFKVHRITIDDVVKEGLTTADFVEEMRSRIPPNRFRREFEAEFVEEENCFLPMDLIKRCIDWEAKFIPDEFFGF
jgi:terminase large subunit-like protein